MNVGAISFAMPVRRSTDQMRCFVITMAKLQAGGGPAKQSCRFCRYWPVLAVFGHR